MWPYSPRMYPAHTVSGDGAHVYDRRTRYLDQTLVTVRRPQVLEDGLGGILLQVLRVRDDLDHAVPHLVADVVARGGDELQDGVDVPLVARCVLLGRDGNLEHHLLAQAVVGDLEVPQQLADDELRVVRVAHAVQQVERAPANGDVLVTQRADDSVLVLLDGLERVGARGEVRHRVEPEVAHVRLLGGDEDGELLCGDADERRVGVEVDREPDGLEEHRVLRVAVLHVARRRPGGLHHGLEHLLQHAEDRRVLYRGLRSRREVNIRTNRWADSIAADGGASLATMGREPCSTNTLQGIRDLPRAGRDERASAISAEHVPCAVDALLSGTTPGTPPSGLARGPAPSSSRKARHPTRMSMRAYDSIATNQIVLVHEGY